MNQIIKQIIREKIVVGEIDASVRQVQAAISKISDRRVSDQDIVKAIVQVTKKGEI